MSEVKNITAESAIRTVAFYDVDKERERQIEEGHSAESDDTHSDHYLIGHIEQHCHTARMAFSGVAETEPREQLVKIAALAVAAIEKIDRAQSNV